VLALTLVLMMFEPQSGFVVTYFLMVSDHDRSREFYRPVFGAAVVGIS